MSERIIKWGFIGCGEVTKYKSGPAFQKIENSEVVAVMSRNGDKAKTYAKLLYDQALLIAGLPLDDPSGYTDLVCGLMK